MNENSAVRALYQDALSGRISRREVLKRGAALGLSAPVLAALAQEPSRVMAAEEGTLTVTYYNWIVQLHPGLETVNQEFGQTFPIKAEVAPTQNFSLDRFVAEAQQQESTWDMYFGVTPFLEMTAMAESGTIEPWDPYLPEGVLEDLHPAIREEGTYNGQLYVWPFLLDVIVQGWNADQVAKAGLDPEVAPKNWDEFIANAQKVKDSGAAPFGLTFDAHDWRSLIPITHSISTDVYTPDGLFMYDSDAAIQALEIMKRMMELANPDVLQPGSSDGGVNDTPDEKAFAAQQACYYIKYQNAHLRFAFTWPDPSQLRLSALPVQEGGAGGTVFWTTGAVLFKYGANKEQAAQYVNTVTRDQRIFQNSITGNPDEGVTAVGQIPVYQSIWQEWEANPPDFLQANMWALDIWKGLEKASAIAPTPLAVSQFDVARPEWHKYLSGEESDPKVAMQKAMDAARAEYKRQTGKDPQ
ncbi:MAG TPA: extracellular solute-binding protein [Thermomicrobiales bacterium]